MPSLIAKINVKEDKVEEAKSFLKDLAASVLSSEEGTLAYVIHQQKDEPTAFHVYEKYADDEAFKIHSKNLAAKGAEFAGIMAGPPEMIFLEEI